METQQESEDISSPGIRQYSIGEAADMLGISIPTIRLYEREGLIIPYRRNSRHRRFSEVDLERIRCLRRMINQEKVSIAGVRKLLALIPCWRIKQCPEEARSTCPAYNQADAPCWAASNKSLNCRSEECRNCAVYTTIADCHMLKQSIAQFTLEPLPGTPP